MKISPHLCSVLTNIFLKQKNAVVFLLDSSFLSFWQIHALGEVLAKIDYLRPHFKSIIEMKALNLSLLFRKNLFVSAFNLKLLDARNGDFRIEERKVRKGKGGRHDMLALARKLEGFGTRWAQL